MPAIRVLSNFELMPLTDLVETEGNPQSHNLTDIKNSILEFGVVQPIVVNDDNRIIGGHGRKNALLELMEEGFDLDGGLVPVVKGSYTEAQAQLLLLALNKVHGQFDPFELADFVDGMDWDDLGKIGFADSELEDLKELLGQQDEFDLDQLAGMDEDGDLMQPRPSGEVELKVTLNKEQAELVTAELERIDGDTANALVKMACTSQNFDSDQIEEYYQRGIRQWEPEEDEI